MPPVQKSKPDKPELKIEDFGDTELSLLLKHEVSNYFANMG